MPSLRRVGCEVFNRESEGARMIDIENIPKLILSHGVHIGKNVEYVGGHIVEITSYFSDKEGNYEENNVTLSMKNLQQIIDWINDIPNIDRNIKKKKFKIVDCL